MLPPIGGSGGEPRRGDTGTRVANDQVSLVGIEGDSPNPHPGATFPALLTVGPAGSNGLFPVLELTVFNGAGTCLTCLWRATDISNLFIGQGATDLELSGFLIGISGRRQAPRL